MVGRRQAKPEAEPNFYVAYTDMALTMVLVMTLIAVLVTLYGRIGWDNIQYKKAQAEVKREVLQAFPKRSAPYVNDGKNDPPGAQRWVFSQRNLFQPGTAVLTPESRVMLLKFARIVKSHDDLWKRLRIEGHTLPPLESNAPDNWRLSAERAEMVTRIFAGAGHIPAFKMAIAGRAGQNPIDRTNKRNPANERVEILIEYALKTGDAR